MHKLKWVFLMLSLLLLTQPMLSYAAINKKPTNMMQQNKSSKPTIKLIKQALFNQKKIVLQKPIAIHLQKNVLKAVYAEPEVMLQLGLGKQKKSDLLTFSKQLVVQFNEKTDQLTIYTKKGTKPSATPISKGIGKSSNLTIITPSPTLFVSTVKNEKIAMNADIAKTPALVVTNTPASLVTNTTAPVVNMPAPVVNTPAPVVNTPVPVVNTPVPVVNTPVPVVNTPAPVVNTPVPVVNMPAPVVNTPAPVVNTPVPVVNTPAPVVNTPAPVVNTPVPVVNTPVPVVNTPVPVVNTPVPVVNTPAPVTNTPAPVTNTPAPVVNTPAPVVNTPAPSPEVTPAPSPEVTPVPSPEVTPVPSPEVTPVPSPFVDPNEPNDTTDLAVLISSNSKQKSYIGKNGDFDVYSFIADQTGTITIDLNVFDPNNSFLDYGFHVNAKDTNLLSPLHVDNASMNENESVSFQVVAGEMYYVTVFGYRESYSDRYPYELIVHPIQASRIAADDVRNRTVDLYFTQSDYDVRKSKLDAMIKIASQLFPSMTFSTHNNIRGFVSISMMTPPTLSRELAENQLLSQLLTRLKISIQIY